ncbi:co-chaperone HscB [Moritella dasanensis]|uniref:co-chaperone HscB n=1 Tax=Moritella dasanensis TaxID=428031 RepID=UPI0002E9C8C9|nr:co-chaperone HscB [Moritella dasanensis]
MNHFELFGLPVNFELDSASLATTYRELQRTLHPDKFANGSERERLLAVQKSSQVNDAYSTLKSPIQRAEYILAVCHEDIRGEQQTLQDPMFLMQQMEQHERLEDIPHAADPEQEIADFDDELSLSIKQYLQEFSQLVSIEHYHDAANVVRKLKFVYKLQTQLSTLEDSLLDY